MCLLAEFELRSLNEISENVQRCTSQSHVYNDCPSALTVYNLILVFNKNHKFKLTQITWTLEWCFKYVYRDASA